MAQPQNPFPVVNENAAGAGAGFSVPNQAAANFSWQEGAPAPAVDSTPRMKDYLSGRDQFGNMSEVNRMDQNLGTIDRSKYQFNNDTSGYQAFKNRATQQGPSAWANMQMQKQGLEQSQGAGQAARQAAAGASQARSAMAMRGGLSGGANQSLARSSMMNRNKMMQANAMQGQQSRLGIGIEDERTKSEFLKGLPQAEMGVNSQALNQQKFYADIDKANADRQATNRGFNIQNQLADLGNQNKYNTGAYASQMSKYGADRTADAMAQGPEKRGGIGGMFDSIFK